MVPSISKFDLRVSKFQVTVRPMKVKANWLQKLIRQVTDHMLLYTQFGVDLITAAQKIRVSLTTYFDNNTTLTFDLEMVASVA
jgi:hypothetical protein